MLDDWATARAPRRTLQANAASERCKYCVTLNRATCINSPVHMNDEVILKFSQEPFKGPNSSSLSATARLPKVDVPCMTSGNGPNTLAGLKLENRGEAENKVIVHTAMCITMK